MNPDAITERAPSGCFVSGLYLEGAVWDHKGKCLLKAPPKVLIEELPILQVIPIEAHRLKLQVSVMYFTESLSCVCMCINVSIMSLLALENERGSLAEV